MTHKVDALNIKNLTTKIEIKGILLRRAIFPIIGNDHNIESEYENRETK